MRRRRNLAAQKQSFDSNVLNVFMISTVLEAASIAGAFPAMAFLIVGEQSVIVDQPYRWLVPLLFFIGLTAYGAVVAFALQTISEERIKDKRANSRIMTNSFRVQAIFSVGAVTTFVWAIILRFYTVVPPVMD